MVEQGVVLDGRYRLVQRIGGGGMGEVWRGEDVVLGRVVAVKILLPALMDEPGFAERFRNEARIMATIKYPGVVEVYDVGLSAASGGGGTAYLVMEHVQGESLDNLLKREGSLGEGKLDPERTVEIVSQAAEALHAAHAAGVIHRDVKPANLLVRSDDSVVLTDFGIARSATSAGLTARGVVLGTATYCAPEQAAGEEITPSADIYALGVVAYQCLAGAPPFEGSTPVMIALKHMRDPLPPLPETVPPALRRVVERALAKAPADRWPDAAAMAEEMREAAGSGKTHPAPAPTDGFDRPAPTGPITERPGRRSRRLRPVLAAMGLVGVLGAGAALMWQMADEQPATPTESPPATTPVILEPDDPVPTGGENPNPAPVHTDVEVGPSEPDDDLPTENPGEEPTDPGEEPTDPGEEPTDPGDDPTGGTGEPGPDVTLPDCEKQAC